MEQEDPIDGALLWVTGGDAAWTLILQVFLVVFAVVAVENPTRTLHLPDAVRVDSEKAMTEAGLAADGIR